MGKYFALGVVCFASLWGQAPPDGERAVRFDSDRVQVDAVVTDSHGAHVRDLKAEDFHVLQDGKTRKVASVTYVPGAGQPRTIVFLINDGNMLATNMVRVRAALHHVADEGLQPGDSVALVTTLGGAGYLRKFVAPGPQLHAAIDDLRWRPAPFDAAVLSRTLDMLRRTIFALSEIPGRKSVIVLSNDMLGERFDVRAIADTASRASVVVNILNPNAVDSPFGPDKFLPGLAAATGGIERPGGLDLAANLRSVLEDQTGFYAISWDPGSVLKQLWGWPVYHRLALSTNRPGLMVRSRDGFFGVSGPLAPTAAASKTQQIMLALHTPLRPQPVAVTVTPVLKHREGGFFLQSLIYIGSGIELTKDKDDCYAAALTIYTSLLHLDSPEDPPLTARGARIRLCGVLAQRVRENGMVATIEQPILEPGSYQINVGVRNGSLGDEGQGQHPNGLIRRADWKQEIAQLGTASEFIDLRELNSARAAFPPLLVRGTGKIPAGSGKASEVLFRSVASGDPVIRDFHRGEVLNYDAGPNATFEILRDGDVVDSGDAHGVYRLKDDLPPGQYILLEKPAGRGDVVQWSDFRVVK